MYPDTYSGPSNLHQSSKKASIYLQNFVWSIYIWTNFLFHAKDEEKKIEEDFKQLHVTRLTIKLIGANWELH
jgi:hypothetical protein